MRKYFELKKFEIWGEKSIYEFLGVKFFKKYLLPTELLAKRLRGGKAAHAGRAAMNSQLRRLEWETRRNEVIHLLALLLIAGLLLVGATELSVVQLLLILAINLYVNVYPIFLQRHNRLRLTRAIEKMQAMTDRGHAGGGR